VVQKIVVPGLFRPAALRVEEDRAEFERGVIGDSELPVRREPVGPGIFEVTVGDGKKLRDL